MDPFMKVPFLDLQAVSRELDTEIGEAVDRVVHSGRYILGPELEAFESEWADYTDSRYCIGVGNGLDAIELSLRALEIGPGDEVIVPSNTFIATWLAVTRTGASVVPVEPVESTYNLDPDRVIPALTDRTKAIIAVHLYGQPADVQTLVKICSRYGVALVEDAAQAHGAKAYGRPVGSWGDVSAWSFYPGKNLGALGDAGAVTTDRADVASRVRLLRNYGSETKYVHKVRGFNSRLDEIQAAVLRVKLKCLPNWNERRQAIADRYRAALYDTDLKLPETASWAEPAWHLFVVRSPARDLLQQHFSGHDVETLIHYPTPPHKQAAYPELRNRNYPISELMHQQVLSLPIGPQMTAEQVERVISVALAFRA
jgi:dTDP-4-amino-4,6-dideoxygalactose transaminase